jgi:protein-S-isoprenylcysteine O-methyltransferase Ste14
VTHDELPAYGLWSLVAINVAVFLIFAYSFAKPASPRDWQSFGAFSGFVVALFAEMYGFPFTIYLMSGWIQSTYPGLDLLSHDAGHLWWTLLGLRGNPHLNWLHIVSGLLIVLGFAVIGRAWPVLHAAQKGGRLATTGIYGYLRHPQYLGFIVVLSGFLLQWPTILTVGMYPFLVWMYVRLAHREEEDTARKFGEAYQSYADETPRWIPRLSRSAVSREA